MVGASGELQRLKRPGNAAGVVELQRSEALKGHLLVIFVK